MIVIGEETRHSRLRLHE